MKTCTKCKIEKELTAFHKKKSNPDGLHYSCKECRKTEGNRETKLAYGRKYWKENKERLSEQHREWKKDNPNYTRERYYKDHEKNKASIRADKRKRRQDPLYYLKDIVCNNISKKIRENGYSKKSRTFDILGCSYQELMLHLEDTWEKNYNCKYEGQAVHIDHIIPISSANTEEEILNLNHYTNLQYLTPEDNMVKGNKYEKRQ